MSKKLSREESDRLLERLREETRATGVGEDAYRRAIQKMDECEEEAREEARRKWGRPKPPAEQGG